MSAPEAPAEASSRLPVPLLPVLKQKFAFRLATTSYIIPGAILPNIRFLGRHLDEVELVLYESQGVHNLPTPAEIRALASLSADFDLTYNVHLPGDLFFGDPDPALRQEFCTTALRFYERTLNLNPTAYVLHLDSRKADGEVEADQVAWHQRIQASLETLQSQGIDLRQVVVENLEYPLDRLVPFAAAFDMGLCLDIGHLLRYGHNVQDQLERFLHRSSMVHLHGVDDGVDHVGLNHIPPRVWDIIGQALKAYQGGVSLEVFNLDDLIPSLERIQELVRGDDNS
jgi:sugar phosphate isomerase/epimerase